MNYDNFFMSLDELLTSINGIGQGEMDTDSADTTFPFCNYIFGQGKDVFEGLDGDMKAFKMSPLD